MTRAIVLLLACLVTACERESDEVPVAPAPIEVQVSMPRRGNAVEQVRAVGETAALTTVSLASPVAGRVTFLSALPGDHVVAGASAAKVIPAENEAALNGFALLDGGAALQPEERALGADLRRKVGARDIVLRAPFDAVVAQRLRNPGELVAANDVLLELFDPRSLYVLAQVPLQEATRIRPGMEVEVESAEGTSGGHVAAVLAVVAPQALTMPVRVAFDSPLRSPLLHAPVDCRITVERRADALLIPRSALLSSNAAEQNVVMVAAGGRAERRSVKLGLRAGDEVEVIEGLSPADVVLRDGQFGISDGSEIHWTENAPK